MPTVTRIYLTVYKCRRCGKVFSEKAVLFWPHGKFSEMTVLPLEEVWVDAPHRLLTEKVSLTMIHVCEKEKTGDGVQVAHIGIGDLAGFSAATTEEPQANA